MIVVPTTFFLAIMLGGWPFTTLTKNASWSRRWCSWRAYVVTYAIFRAFFNYDFMQGAPGRIWRRHRGGMYTR